MCGCSRLSGTQAQFRDVLNPETVERMVGHRLCDSCRAEKSGLVIMATIRLRIIVNRFLDFGVWCFSVGETRCSGFGVFVSGSSLTTRRHFSPLLPESQGEETRNNGQLQTQLACAIFGTSPCKGTYPLAKVSGFWAWRWVDCSLKCCSVEIAAPALANHHVVGTVSRQRRRANGDLEVFRELSGVRYLTSKHQSDDSLLCCT